MKTKIGGDRLGSGNKQEVSLRNYERSSHDIGYIWRSSMASGTLVPFMSELSLSGTTMDIDLECEVLTLPTIGPLFGSYKVQLDVFEVPIRLYNAGLHMNRLGIGMSMSDVYLPQVLIATNNDVGYRQTFEDNEQINSSALLKYLGIGGIGAITGTSDPAERLFNAVPYLGYWDIYKNYYANKQEDRGFVIHTSTASVSTNQAVTDAILYIGFSEQGSIFNSLDTAFASAAINLTVQFGTEALEPDPEECTWAINGNTYTIAESFNNIVWNDSLKQWRCTSFTEVETGSVGWILASQNVLPLGGVGAQVSLYEFDLNDIDNMREDILQFPFASGELDITTLALEPYNLHLEKVITGGADATYSIQYTQEGLGIKTYQSDLFNNWISTEWIDGVNGVNELSKVSTAGDEFTIDALNIAYKVYNLLNRVAISGGSYDDWLDAVYTHERSKSVESPIYHGSLIKELAFQEVVSNSETTEQPLGTLAGRGRLTQKNKGGKIRIKTDEPSYIIGIVSLTPRIDYSQGNKWDVNLKTMDDLHKPALDGIGYQDLITEQMLWSDSEYNSTTGVLTQYSAGKQPAWINYMTNYNRVYGHFAEENNSMFMTLNRRYDKDSQGSIEDLTTYIDPTKFNHIFAETQLDAQNFWVQINNKITARRKMSAKQIPNL